MDSFRYRAFISYSHDDERHARWLHKSLENYRVPKRVVQTLGLDHDRIRPVFRDRDELRAAGNLSAELRDALSASACLIVLCSPASASSAWVNEEVRFFKSLGRGNRVLCAIVAGDGPVNGLFAEALLYEVDAAGLIQHGTPQEPLAADLRKSGDGKRRGLLKLVAGVLGSPLDTLVQRDQARRVRVLASVAVLSVVGMLGAAGLAGYAFEQRAEADRQRASAVTEAETARQVVAFLVGLFEISNPATQNPRTITALEILKKGSQNIRDSFEDRPEAKAVLLATLGEVYFNLGLYDESADLLKSGVDLLAPTSLRALSARTMLGNVASKQGKYDAADVLFREVRAALDAEHPDAFKARGEVELGWGTLKLLGSKQEEAAQHYEQAAVWFGRADDAKPRLAKSLEGLANTYTDRGNYARAEQILREAIAMKETSLGREHVETAATYHNLAVLHVDMGQFDDAIDDVNHTLAVFGRVLEPDHPNVAMANMTLGRAQYLSGRTRDGIEHLRLATTIGERAYGRNNLFNAIVRVYLARALSADGQAQAALATLDDARGIYVEVVGDDDSYIGDWLVNRAAVQLQSGDKRGALKSCEEGLARLDHTGDAALRATFGKECDTIITGIQGTSS